MDQDRKNATDLGWLVELSGLFQEAQSVLKLSVQEWHLHRNIENVP